MSEPTLYSSGPVFVLPPMKMLEPPQPIDAKGSLSNDELRKIAEKHAPPQSWHDDDFDPFAPHHE